MLKQTEAIVLNSLPYNDSNRIVALYTHALGKISIIAIKSRKGNNCLFQPFSIINSSIEIKQNRELQRVKDFDIVFAPNSITLDIAKNAIAIFLVEFLSKVIQTEQADVTKYNYLNTAIKLLEVSDNSISNFHIVFLIQFSKFLGIFPEQNTDFVLQLSRFINSNELLEISLADCHKMQLTQVKRKEIISYLLDYYRLYYPDFKNFKSLEILNEIFS